MILTGYFDESGTHVGSGAVSVAGYLSTPYRWVRFEEQWRAALEEFSIEFFHMADFANHAPPYDTWTEEKRRAQFARLVQIINQNAEFSVGNVVPTALFDEIFSPHAKTYLGGEYGLAAISTFMSVGKIMRERYPDQWVGYVFESGARGAGQVLKVFQDNEQRADQKRELRLLSLRFEDKRQFLPLQAADILAYELYVHLPRQLGTNRRNPRRFHLEPLAAIPKDWGHIERPLMNEFAKIIEIRRELDRLGPARRARSQRGLVKTGKPGPPHWIS